MAGPIRSKTARMQSGRSTRSAPWFSRALACSLAAHGLIYATVVISQTLEWKDLNGVAPRTPEVLMVARRSARMEERERELDIEIEIPRIIEMVDVVEEVAAEKPPEPVVEEQLDPLLEVDLLEELAAEALPTPVVEPVVEEPVGEESEPQRRVLESPVAVYPRLALMRRLEGSVVLILSVDAAGAVVDVELVESSGFGLLDRAAIAAARGYRFEEGEAELLVGKTITFQLP